MCHELRNPLHVLKSTLALLLEDNAHENAVVPVNQGTAAEQRQEMVADVLSALDRMEATVNDVLDFRKLDAQMFVMNRTAVSLRTMVDSICRHARAFLKSNVQLGYRVTPPDAEVMLDQRRMFQIIINGLSNAGKFTPEGAVAVDVTVLLDGTGKQHVAVTVSNTTYTDGLADPEACFVPFRGTHQGKAATSGMPYSVFDSVLLVPLNIDVPAVVAVFAGCVYQRAGSRVWRTSRTSSACSSCGCSRGSGQTTT